MFSKYVYACLCTKISFWPEVVILVSSVLLFKVRLVTVKVQVMVQRDGVTNGNTFSALQYEVHTMPAFVLTSAVL